MNRFNHSTILQRISETLFSGASTDNGVCACFSENATLLKSHRVNRYWMALAPPELLKDVINGFFEFQQLKVIECTIDFQQQVKQPNIKITCDTKRYCTKNHTNCWTKFFSQQT